MLKRGSGTRRLPMFSNINSRAARVELLKQTRNNSNNNNNNSNNNLMEINEFENNGSVSNIVSATPSPAPTEALHAIRSASPVLAARSVRHMTLGARRTANVRNPMQHAVAFGKQKLETLRVSGRRRKTRRNRNNH